MLCYTVAVHFFKRDVFEINSSAIKRLISNIYITITKAWCQALTLQSFIVLDPTFRSWIHFGLIFIHNLRKGLTSLFYTQISSVPSTIYWKDCLSPLTGLGIFAKNHLTIHARVSFWSLHSVPLVYMFIFMSVPH